VAARGRHPNEGDSAVSEWRKSSFSNLQNCVEVAFRKSTYSTHGSNCVEVGVDPCGPVLVRDSKDPQGPVLTFTAAEWAAFKAGVAAGEFDR
jgi:hypothetical protein